MQLRDQRRHADRIAEVVGIEALRQAGAGHRLDRQDARLQALAQLLADKGESQASEIAAAARTADRYIRMPARALQLHQYLDDRLVHQDVIEHAAERILDRAAAHGRHLESVCPVGVDCP